MLSRAPVLAWAGLGVALALVAGRGAPAARGLDRAWFVAVVPGTLLLCMATVPEWYRDSLTYHAALPRHFAQAGGYAPMDDNVFASFPLGWESILAQLCSFGEAPDRYPPFELLLAGVWVTLALTLATGGLAGLLGASPRVAALGGLTLLLVPTFVEFGPSSYVEPWLLLLATLALAAALSGRPALAGALAGLAASSKYPGLAVALFVGVVLLADALRRPDPRRELRRIPVFLVMVVSFAAPFYVRKVLERGNPVFPLAWELWGGPGWDAWRASAYAATLREYGLGRAPVDTLLLPWRLFTTTDLRDGFEGSLGPVVGLGLLVGACRARTDRGCALVLLFAVLWSLFWAINVQQVRFYLVAVPPLLALLAAGLGSVVRAGAALLFAAAWAAPVVPGLWQRQLTSEWLSGELGREAILETLLPGGFGAMRGLEAEVPEDGRLWLVWTQAQTYYLRREMRLDCVFEGWRFEALLDEQPSAAEFGAALRREGFTHVLIDRRFLLWRRIADLTEGRTDRLRRRFEAVKTAGVLDERRCWGPMCLYRVGGGGADP